MFDIQYIATTEFERAISAMRRENGGCEVCDSYWIYSPATGGCFYEIGEGDKAECLRLLKKGDSAFMDFIGVWAHIEAPAQWWESYGDYFIAQSNVKQHGEQMTRSIFATYGNLRRLIITVSGEKDNQIMQS